MSLPAPPLHCSSLRLCCQGNPCRTLLVSCCVSTCPFPERLPPPNVALHRRVNPSRRSLCPAAFPLAFSPNRAIAIHDVAPQGDPFKTLFVSRLSYDVTERKLKREFEEYGPIKRIRLVHDKNSGGCCTSCARL